jgi:hypothetical protein
MVTASGSVEPLHHIHQDEARLTMIELACDEASFGHDGWVRLPQAEDWAVYNTIAHEARGYEAEWNPYVYDSPMDEVISLIEDGHVEWAVKHLRMEPDEVILALCRIYGATTMRQWFDDDLDARLNFRERHAKADLRRTMRRRELEIAKELSGPPLEVDDRLY